MSSKSGIHAIVVLIFTVSAASDPSAAAGASALVQAVPPSRSASDARVVALPTRLASADPLDVALAAIDVAEAKQGEQLSAVLAALAALPGRCVVRPGPLEPSTLELPEEWRRARELLLGALVTLDAKLTTVDLVALAKLGRDDELILLALRCRPASDGFLVGVIDACDDTLQCAVVFNELRVAPAPESRPGSDVARYAGAALRHLCIAVDVTVVDPGSKEAAVRRSTTARAERPAPVALRPGFPVHRRCELPWHAPEGITAPARNGTGSFDDFLVAALAALASEPATGTPSATSTPPTLPGLSALPTMVSLRVEWDNVDALRRAVAADLAPIEAKRRLLLDALVTKGILPREFVDRLPAPWPFLPAPWRFTVHDLRWDDSVALPEFAAKGDGARDRP